eukprot:1159015-Pelagomonas_calceolata.AAC.9
MAAHMQRAGKPHLQQAEEETAMLDDPKAAHLQSRRNKRQQHKAATGQVHSQEAEEQAVHEQQEDEPEGESVEQVAPRRPQHAKWQVLLHHNEDHCNDIKHHTLHIKWCIWK